MKQALVALIVKECEMPDGRHNVLRFDLEELRDGGATFYIKHNISYDRFEVSGEEWRDFCIFALRSLCK